MNNLIIGVGGYARSGKNTFVDIASKIVEKAGYNSYSVAFGNALKFEVNSMLIENGFNSSAYTEDSELKKILRPLLVWWGCQRRFESNDGMYWITHVNKQISKIVNTSTKNIVFISDVRFKNEAEFIHTTWNGIVIHLKRWNNRELMDKNGIISIRTYDDAPNEEERKQDPFVQELSDYHVEWPNQAKSLSEAIDEPILKEIVLNTLNSIKYFNGSLLL